jgi:eukaryotic-like serine/threonine-protein kinase
MACPAETELQHLVEGALVPEASELLHRHLDACPACCALVGELARREDEPPALLERGTSVDRFLVLEPIGTGAMGVVYAAFDPRLDRRVALKLVRPDVGTRNGAAAREQLLAEARGLARLNHPHVVTVYEAGTWGEQLFLAMEYVPGATLTAWLRLRPHPWQEVLRVFLDAGEGLWAAHAAGLVHRDFKPDNVLLGADGRTRVTDFGLVRASGGTSDETALAGTPAYMAPEQWAHHAVDARADQFAFCVALWEALDGARPFAGKDEESLSRAVSQGDVQPARARLPPFLRRALLRGLAARPEDRWPDLGALLAALRRTPLRPSLVAAGVAAALLLVGVGTWVGTSVVHAERPCLGGPHLLASTWDEARRSAVRSALASAGTPYADVAADGAVRALDGYADGWLGQYAEACQATRVRGEQSEAALDLRTGCLQRRLRDLGALADLFERAPGTVSERAVQAAYALPPLRECAELDTLSARARLPVDAEARARVAEVQGELSAVRALVSAGDWSAATRARAESMAGRARDTGHQPTLAEASHQLGVLLAKAQEARASQAALSEAVFAAEAGHDDRLATRARIDVVAVMAEQELRDAATDLPVREARAALARLGSDAELEARLALATGALRVAQERCQEALPHLRQAQTLSEVAWRDENPTRAEVLDALGNALRCTGNFSAARAQHQASLLLRERTLGKAHPEVAVSLNNLGNVFVAEEEVAHALPLHQRALDIRVRALGEDALPTAQARYNLGTDLILLGQRAEGREHVVSALAAQEAILGRDSPRLAFALATLGHVDIELGQPARAVGELERALLLLHGREDVLAATARFNLAWALGELRRERGRAHLLAREARAYFVGRHEAGAAQLRTIDTWLERHRD